MAIMDQVAKRVYFKADSEAEEETVKVYVVVNSFEFFGGNVLKTFKLKSDAIEYASMEADMNELDEYVVLEMELL
jgi:hypothetical protein